MCCNNCNQLYLSRDVSRENNPMYFSTRTEGSSLDLLRNIIPDTRAYVVEGGEIVREITEELVKARDNYYPLWGGEMYPSNRVILQDNKKEEQKGDNLREMIDRARKELKLNFN